jgi:tRNA(fMet)-specific endonuclease VapC
MARVVVDTDVVSYLIKGDTRAALYRPHLSGQDLCIAFSTVAELYRWAVRSQWGQQRVDALRAMLAGYSVLAYDDDTAWGWARVMSLPGHPMSHADAWIAAAALRHGLPLVTHNRKHFEPVPGLTIISEG